MEPTAVTIMSLFNSYENVKKKKNVLNKLFLSVTLMKIAIRRSEKKANEFNND